MIKNGFVVSKSIFGMLKSVTLFFFLIVLLNSYAQVDSIMIHTIEEVEVVAQSKPSVSQSASLLQTMTNDDFERIGVQSMADAVRRFAGVVVKDYGGIGGLKTVSFRGFDAQHTGVAYDGINVGEAQSGQVDIGKFSMENVSMISFSVTQPDDILQSARYFSTASILNIKTSNPKFENRNYKVQISVKAGSFGLFNPSAYYLRKINENWSASINGEWQRADSNYPFDFSNGSTNEKRKRYNSDVNIGRAEFNLYGDMKAAGNLRFKANYFDSERGLPAAAIKNNTYSGERLWDTDFFMQAGYDNRISNALSIQGLSKFSRYYKKYKDSNINYKTNNRYKQYEYYGSVAGVYKPSKFISFSLAQDYIYNTVNMFFYEGEDSDDDTVLSFPWNEAYRHTFLTALNGQFKNERICLTLTALNAYYKDDVKKGSKPENKKRLSPSVSISYKPFDTELRFRAFYKDIYRVPTMNDMYYSHIGNTALKPETTKQYNIGLTYQISVNSLFNYVYFSIDGYYNKVKDKIIPHSISLLQWKMMNVDNVSIKGFDVTANSELFISSDVNLFLNATYSYRYAKDDDRNLLVLYTPRHAGTASASFETSWVNLSYSLVYSDKMYSGYPLWKLNRIDSFWDHTISANRSFDYKTNSIRLQADIINLSNKNYSMIKGYPMPGRSFRIGVTWNF